MLNGINKIIGYFDLQSAKRGVARVQDAAGGSLRVIPQYAALVLGILVQPYLENFRTTGRWLSLSSDLLSWGLFSLIAGLVVFPGVYRKSFDVDQPKFVQFCIIFVAGIGWKTLFATASKLGA